MKIAPKASRKVQPYTAHKSAHDKCKWCNCRRQNNSSIHVDQDKTRWWNEEPKSTMTIDQCPNWCGYNCVDVVHVKLKKQWKQVEPDDPILQHFQNVEVGTWFHQSFCVKDFSTRTLGCIQSRLIIDIVISKGLNGKR